MLGLIDFQFVINNLKEWKETMYKDLKESIKSYVPPNRKYQ
jgi:hypothetical protein